MTRYDPLIDHPAHGQATHNRDPWAPTHMLADNNYAVRRRRRLIVSVVGIAGFLILLIGAHFVGGLQKPVQAAALFWFLAFGLVRFGLDVARL